MYHYNWLEALLDAGLGSMFDALHVSKDDQVAILMSWAVCGLLVALALVGRAGLTAMRAQGGTLQYVPERTLTARNFWEMFVGALDGMATDILGKKDGRAFYPLVAGLFIYILTSNLIGLVPGLSSPTANLNNNLAMAVVVVVVFNVAGLRRNGIHFVKHLFGPVWWLAPLMFLIETLTLFVVRPYSLSLRLMGNMFGDHMVFGIMSDLTRLVFPCIFLGLGIFVSFIQALVFTLLSSIYIALAVAHEEEGTEGGGHAPAHS